MYSTHYDTSIYCMFQCLPATWYELEILHIIFIFLNAVMWISLYHASTTDPGFLPRNIPEYDRAIKEVKHFWLILLQYMHTASLGRRDGLISPHKARTFALLILV